ncbi:MAG: glycosyltransferase family 4 protein [Paracoccus sp. (in: a-proteobacteria)]|uniref:glycosyltransferase family 4 protein n=1 Tax=Paracoccus sp. TaxID=267 RepID=UPI00391A9DD1
MTDVLTLIPSVPATMRDGVLWLDDKFTEGLRTHARHWSDGKPGAQMRVLIRRTDAVLPFAKPLDPRDLPCELRLLAPDAQIGAADLAGSGVVLASADDHTQLELPAICGATGAKLVYVIEYDLRTRMTFARMDSAGRPLRMLRRGQWLLRHELRLRRALSAADGLQANGFPAMAAYGGLNRNLCLYLDGRMTRERMASPEQMAGRADHAGPIRIIHSGRLIAAKGCQDLVPFAAALRRRNVDFRLDIYGHGDMKDQIAADLARRGLLDVVHLHAPVDFAQVLVPLMQSSADLFLAPHRQSDPSCSYLEAMGCGLPVLGSNNGMWRALLARSDAGWMAPSGRPDAMAECCAGLTRAMLTEAGARALAYAQAHDFETEFAHRIDHLRATAATAAAA